MCVCVCLCLGLLQPSIYTVVLYICTCAYTHADDRHVLNHVRANWRAHQSTSKIVADEVCVCECVQIK